MSVAAAEVGNANAAGTDGQKKQPNLTREDKVKYIVGLLRKKGESGAQEIKKRIANNSPIVAKEITFDASVLQEALGIWTLQNSKGGGGDPIIIRGGADAGRVGSKRPLAAAASSSQGQPEASRVAKLPRTDSVKDSAATSSKPPSPSLLRMRRVCSLDGTLDRIDRTSRTTSTPCRSSRGSPQGHDTANSPGVPNPTAPSNGRSATPNKSSFSSPAARKSSLPIPKVAGASGAPRRLSRPSASPSAEVDSGKTSSSSGNDMDSRTFPSLASKLKQWAQATTEAAKAEVSNSKLNEGSRKRSVQVERSFEVERSPAAPQPFMKAREESAETPRVRTEGTEWNLSVRELKEQLGSHGIDFSNCVEKSDLQDLWSKFDTLCQRPLAELQASLAAASIGSGAGTLSPPRTVSACAAQLLGAGSFGNTPAQSHPTSSSTAPPQPTARTPSFTTQEQDSPDSWPSSAAAAASSAREQEAATEVRRIESIRRDRYGSLSAWGFKVLAVESRNLAAVQRGYRALMKKLHPDKVQHSAAVSRALEALKEAKDACERQLSTQCAPNAPRSLSYTPICTIPGRRRYRLHWTPPTENESSAVRRYIVAAFDPAYGKALNIAVLEPDYSEELRRFVTIEEVNDFVLSEEELQKMPSLWRQAFATMQVAAANDAGQSSWATLQVPLSSASLSPTPQKSSPSLASRLYEWQGSGTPNTRDDERAFAEELRSRAGAADIRGWLERQRKPQLAAFCKSVGWPEEGNKPALVEKVILILDWEKTRR